LAGDDETVEEVATAGDDIHEHGRLRRGEPAVKAHHDLADFDAPQPGSVIEKAEEPDVHREANDQRPFLATSIPESSGSAEDRPHRAFGLSHG
jgi:hypothetical protein